VLATIVSTWELSNETLPPKLATASILLIAALKARLVLLYFMELRHVHGAWRRFFELWVLLVTVMIFGLYWLADSA